MGYLKGLINASKKRKEDGTVIYFPFGTFSDGYIIDEKTEAKIDTFLKKYYISLFSIIFIGALVHKFAPFLAIILLPWYYSKINSVLEDCPQADEQLTLPEQNRKMAQNMGSPTILGLLFLSLVLLIGSIWLLIFSGTIFLKIVSIVSILLFSAGIVQFGYMIWHYYWSKSE